jgi:hypothetical protein
VLSDEGNARKKGNANRHGGTSLLKLVARSLHLWAQIVNGLHAWSAKLHERPAI